MLPPDDSQDVVASQDALNRGGPTVLDRVDDEVVQARLHLLRGIWQVVADVSRVGEIDRLQCVKVLHSTGCAVADSC